MIVTVRKKQFSIELVSNYVRRLYNEIVELSNELAVAEVEAFDWAEKRKEKLKDNKADIKAINKEFNTHVERLHKIITNNHKEIIEKRNIIIRELLESNEHEYDFNWWDRRTSVEDLNEFMLACLDKDRAGQKPSKKK